MPACDRTAQNLPTTACSEQLVSANGLKANSPEILRFAFNMIVGRPVYHDSTDKGIAGVWRQLPRVVHFVQAGA
jgi:hypothetical protein